jgi:hypothetical protein
VENVTLKLTIGSFSVEVTGSPEYAEKKLEELVARYLTSAKPPTSEPRPAAAVLGADAKKMSPTEFLKKAQVKNQPDRAVVLSYFLEKTEGVSSFTTSELGDMGRNAKYPFGNVSDVVAKLVSRGLMMSAGEKEGQRAYALTGSGEEYVESLLQAK